MSGFRTYILFCLFAASASMPAPAADPVKLLRADMAKIFSDARLADAQLGVEIYSLDRSEMLYGKNPQKLMVPASNNKILTAAAALICVGPDYRFKTKVWANGFVSNGVLQGDLIIEGFGDPSSSSRIEPGDPFRAFRSWAARLKENGIHTIAGSIIGEGGSFEEIEHGRGWAWDDLAEGYAAPVTALQFNENMMELEMTPGAAPGSSISIRPSPLPGYLNLDNRALTDAAAVSPRIRIDRAIPRIEALLIRGVLPLKSAAVRRTVSVQNPTLYYLSALKYTLSQEGIHVADCGIEQARNNRPSSSVLLWEHASAPISELLAPVMKMSLNLGSETLARVLGMETRGEGSFLRGKEAVEEVLLRMGIHRESYVYADGSGLSRLNLISAHSLIHVLEFMHRHEYSQIFRNALAVAGVDGTLETRMQKPGLSGNVRAKTGSFSNVSALSGYMQTADKETLAFSFLTNNFVVPRALVESTQEKALARLAAFSRKSPKGRSQNQDGGTRHSGF